MAVLGLLVGIAVAAAGWMLRISTGETVPGFEDRTVGLLLVCAGVLTALTALFAHVADRRVEDDPAVSDALLSGTPAPARND